MAFLNSDTQNPTGGRLSMEVDDEDATMQDQDVVQDLMDGYYEMNSDNEGESGTSERENETPTPTPSQSTATSQTSDLHYASQESTPPPNNMLFLMPSQSAATSTAASQISDLQYTSQESTPPPNNLLFSPTFPESTSSTRTFKLDVARKAVEAVGSK